MTWDEVVASARRKMQAIEDHVRTHGTCFACKKNKVIWPEAKCVPCAKREAELLRQLSGPGFMGIVIRRG